MAAEISAPPRINRNRRALILLVVIAPVFYLFVVRGMRFFEVPSISMENTLRVGDRLVTLTQAAYGRGDIVVFKDTVQGEYVVKRIVGVAGDTLNVDTGALYIDGEFASEPYIAEPMAYEFARAVTLGAGEVFVLGDNRNWSADSHVDLLPTPVDNIVGKVVYRYYPIDRAGPVDSYPLTNLSGK
jgi:signal peptidase I